MCTARLRDSGTTGREYVKYQVSAELYFNLGTCVFYFIPEMNCDLELTVAHECKPSTALLTVSTQRTDPLEAPGEPVLHPLWEHLQRQPVPPQRASGGGSETTAHQCWSRKEIQCHSREEADSSERATGVSVSSQVGSNRHRQG